MSLVTDFIAAYTATKPPDFVAAASQIVGVVQPDGSLTLTEATLSLADVTALLAWLNTNYV